MSTEHQRTIPVQMERRNLRCVPLCLVKIKHIQRFFENSFPFYIRRKQFPYHILNPMIEHDNISCSEIICHIDQCPPI